MNKGKEFFSIYDDRSRCRRWRDCSSSLSSSLRSCRFFFELNEEHFHQEENEDLTYCLWLRCSLVGSGDDFRFFFSSRDL